MILEIADVLDAHAISSVRTVLDSAPFGDGRASAGALAARNKQNEEIDQAGPQQKRLDPVVMGALYAHPEFRRAVIPERVSRAWYARYGEGMAYGPHLDDPVMGEGTRFRSDVAITVFLNEPADYDGGELVIGRGPRHIRRSLPRVARSFIPRPPCTRCVGSPEACARSRSLGRRVSCARRPNGSCSMSSTSPAARCTKWPRRPRPRSTSITFTITWCACGRRYDGG